MLEVARELPGATLVRRLPGPTGGLQTIAATIVEVEAYDGPRDLASHAARGRTRRTEVMFGEAGHAYVFLIYGMYHCLNVVTGPRGYPAAVLIRAVSLPGEPARTAAGPGRLTRALGIDLSFDGADLCRRPSPRAPDTGGLWIASGAPGSRPRLSRGPRIGVDYAGVWATRPWRFALAGHPAISVRFPKSRRT